MKVIRVTRNGSSNKVLEEYDLLDIAIDNDNDYAVINLFFKNALKRLKELYNQ